uniref:Uncharacterized protein n=1 Tax=Castor canadensis TaxID=51338 RepID=A0A8C0XL55_CASCN
GGGCSRVVLPSMQERSPRDTRLAPLPSRRRRGQRRGVGFGRDPHTGSKGESGVPSPRESPHLVGDRGRTRALGRAPFPPAYPPDPTRSPARDRGRTRAVPGLARTFDHVAVDGGAELLARALVEVLPVDDPHLLQEGGLAALARAQQQDLHQPLHQGPEKPTFSFLVFSFKWKKPFLCLSGFGNAI